jgi:hypothetical protein
VVRELRWRTVRPHDHELRRPEGALSTRDRRALRGSQLRRSSLLIVDGLRRNCPAMARG